MTNKDIIFEEKAEIVDQVKFEADQFVTIVKAEKSSQTAKPGQFAFVECGGIPFSVDLFHICAHQKKMEQLSLCTKP